MARSRTYAHTQTCTHTRCILAFAEHPPQVRAVSDAQGHLFALPLVTRWVSLYPEHLQGPQQHSTGGGVQVPSLLHQNASALLASNTALVDVTGIVKATTVTFSTMQHMFAVDAG
eukprot:scaffold83578_cov20-Tisochrysis_lutea.AAC.2